MVMVLVANNEVGLGNLICKVNQYCNKWQLEANQKRD